MTNDRTQPSDPDSRRLIVRRYAIVAAILIAIALSNAFSEHTDLASFGDALPLWKPLVWEFSSVILVGALIPVLAWFNRRFPIAVRRWYRAAPIHLLATLPFSIVHVAGMVGLRSLAYAIVGETYHFGPVLPNWLYEYRKDFVTYWVILAFLCLSEAWRYWRAMQMARSTPAPATPAQVRESMPVRPDKLVVRKLNREFILDTADIVRVESDGNYVTVHANGATYQLRGTLAGLSKRLDDRRFVQVHRSQVVNIDHIREIQPWDHGDYRVLLKDGNVVNFSRRYRARLQQLFEPPAEARPESAARH
ncbi:MAG: LytTR family transcriptional regulator [Rhodanobacteraceae bacterium]|nr:MAG: LytTR family transcriptional regulator [Rhodanobacteraceae bacterium]